MYRPSSCMNTYFESVCRKIVLFCSSEYVWRGGVLASRIFATMNGGLSMSVVVRNEANVVVNVELWGRHGERPRIA